MVLVALQRQGEGKGDAWENRTSLPSIAPTEEFTKDAEAHFEYFQTDLSPLSCLPASATKRTHMTATSTATDRRVRRTRLALRDAMLELLPERGWDELNVQEICDRANVGRSTFYLHFAGKEELLGESLNALRDTLQLAPSAQSEPFRFVRGLLEHVFEQRAVSRAIVGRRSALVVQRRFSEMVFELVQHELASMAPDSWRRQAAARYIAGALVELIAWWLESNEGPDASMLEAAFQRFTHSAWSELE